MNQQSQAILLLKRYLRQNNVTQEEYAEMIGVSTGTISSFMNEKKLRKDSYLKIIKGFPNPFIRLRMPTQQEIKKVTPNNNVKMTIQQLKSCLEYLRQTLSVNEILSQMGMSTSHYYRVTKDKLTGPPRQALLNQYAELPIVKAYLENNTPKFRVNVEVQKEISIEPQEKMDVQDILEQAVLRQRENLEELESLNKILKETKNTKIGNTIISSIVSRITEINPAVKKELN